MGRKIEKPKDPQAPAYFVQYAALWCIMLAFFVVLLTMGHERTNAYKAGVGFIRDAFGLKGGLGMFIFWRKSTEGRGDQLPQPQRLKQDEKGDLVAYVKGMLWKEGLSSVSILHTEFDDRGVSVTIAAPVQFVEDSAVLDRPSCQFLSRVGGIFYNLPDCVFTVMCTVTNAGGADADLRLATQRSAAVVRFFNEQCRIARSQLDATGFSHDRYLRKMSADGRINPVLLSIRKINKPIMRS
jgi:hypothetical protein